MSRKKIIVSLLLIAFTMISSLFYFGELGDHLSITKSSFAKLPGWQQDNTVTAFSAFQHSCQAINKLNPNAKFGKIIEAGLAQDWQVICNAAAKLSTINPTTSREFFEKYFQPYHVLNHLNSQGLFTGYYLPLLQASLKRTPQYAVPIYALPSDLIRINLNAFQSALPNKTIIAKFANHQLTPYPTRAMIMSGELQDNASIVAWTQSWVDLYFAQVQGSAVLQLPNHELRYIKYAGSNGHDYNPIGRVLIRQHAITKQNISMQSIRAWLADHTNETLSILQQDPSYVFFNMQKNSDVTGSQNVPLTSRRSLAVDTKIISLGTPVWLDTTIPSQDLNQEKPFQQLMIAQDTGGAIKGIVRADVYWGAGDEAEYIAGHMKSHGQYWILLPK